MRFFYSEAESTHDQMQVTQAVGRFLTNLQW